MERREEPVAQGMTGRAHLDIEPAREGGVVAAVEDGDVGLRCQEPQAVDLVGQSGRVRVRPSLYLVGEITPRLAGYDPGVNQIGFGIEGRAGGHLFQLNFSNGYGTTLGQLARGGITNDNWYFGFNISRKFF